MKNVDVIIVNYQTASLTIAAAQSVLADPSVNQVVIVDSGSADGSVALLQDFAHDKPVRVVASPENVGFGQANNLGLVHTVAPYIFLLNSDATLFQGELKNLVAPLERDPAIGQVAPVVLLPDKKTRQADVQGLFPTAWRLLTRQTSRPTNVTNPDWLSGVALMMRRADFAALGGFDRRYFMYYEDVDLSWRFGRRSQHCAISPNVTVIHLGGASSQSTRAKKLLYYQSQDQFLRQIQTPKWLELIVRLARRAATQYG